MLRSLVGSEMCIRDRLWPYCYHPIVIALSASPYRHRPESHCRPRAIALPHSPMTITLWPSPNCTTTLVRSDYRPRPIALLSSSNRILVLAQSHYRPPLTMPKNCQKNLCELDSKLAEIFFASRTENCREKCCELQIENCRKNFCEQETENWKNFCEPH